MVDYLLGIQIFSNITQFDIGELSEFSNHATVTFSTKINTNIDENSSGGKTSYKQNARHSEAFIADVSKDIKNLEKEVNQLIHNQCSTDKVVEVVTEYLTSRGNPYFERTT